MMMWNVAHLMTENPYCVRPHVTVPDLVKALVTRKITGAPVVSGEGQLVGVVSLVDVAAHSHITSLRKLTVEDIMATKVISVAPEARLGVALELFRRHRVHRLVVCSQGQVVGLLSVIDLLRVVEVIAQDQTRPLEVDDASPRRSTFV